MVADVSDSLPAIEKNEVSIGCSYRKTPEIPHAQSERIVREACKRLAPLLTRHTASWRTVVFSTGEAELATQQDADGRYESRTPRHRRTLVLSAPVLGFGELNSRDISISQFGALQRTNESTNTKETASRGCW